MKSWIRKFSIWLDYKTSDWVVPQDVWLEIDKQNYCVAQQVLSIARRTYGWDPEIRRAETLIALQKGSE